MINWILKALTKKNVKRNCSFCKKEFSPYEYKTLMPRLGLVGVIEVYCSKKCEKARKKAIGKTFRGKKLTKQEKEAIKDIRYVDF